MKRSVRSCLVDTISKKAHVQNVICGSDLSFTIKRHNTLAEFPQFTLISSIDHLNSSIMKTIVSVSNLFCILIVPYLIKFVSSQWEISIAHSSISFTGCATRIDPPYCNRGGQSESRTLYYLYVII